jgi:hypothetical protein
MATVQKNGSSAVTETSTVNNGGVMTANGTSAANVLRSQQAAAAQVGVYANVVVDNADADKALSGGTFAYNNATPTAIKITTSLAGVSNDFLRSGGNDTDNAKSINKLEVVRTRRTTTAIRNNKWNEYAGEWEAGFPSGAVDTFWDISAGSGVSTSTDDAAAPTQSVPGDLVYLQGSPTPKLDNYKAKTNY